MTIEEMKRKLGEFCKTQHCGICPLGFAYGCDYDTEEGFIISDDKVTTAYEAAFQKSTGTTETVNHPKHYGREGAMECIDEMILVFGVEATMHFCLLNAWKYRYRAADKNGAEDLKKSDWYMKMYRDLSNGKESCTCPNCQSNTNILRFIYCSKCGTPTLIRENDL